jgi:CRISPR/Cas system-associated endonuclease Cas3-HD
MKTELKPFSIGYVIKTTSKHMEKSLEISISKTSERIAEFDGNQEKSAEVLKTLMVLHAMGKMLEEFKAINKDLFAGQ